MSSFIRTVAHPKTKKMMIALYQDDYYGSRDDYYGSRIYGVGFRKDGKDFDWKDCNFEEMDFFRENEIEQTVILSGNTELLSGETLEKVNEERERIKMLITEEINIAHSEGTPSARLTSLYNKI